MQSFLEARTVSAMADCGHGLIKVSGRHWHWSIGWPDRMRGGSLWVFGSRVGVVNVLVSLCPDMVSQEKRKICEALLEPWPCEAFGMLSRMFCLELSNSDEKS